MELELGEEQFLGFVRCGIAAEDQGAAVGGGEVNVEHLESRELLEERAWGQAGGFLAKLVPPGGVEAEGEEGDEDMGLDAMLELMMDGAQRQIPP